MFKRNLFTGTLPLVSGLDLIRLQASGLLLCFLALTCASAKTAQAQAIPTSTRTGGRIDAYGTYTFTKPDYGSDSNNGFSVGADYLLRKFVFGQPGLTFRYSRTTGDAVKETFVGAGVESYYHFHRVNPYALVLFGVGGLTILPRQSFYSDSGIQTTVGGGVDVPIAHRLSARGEFDYGFLHISGTNGSPVDELSLTPASVNVGLVYNIR